MDGGRHWTVISPDLTREDPGVPATLDPAAAADAPRPGRRHGVIYAIAPSRLADHDLWIGTDDGLVWRTRDEGAHWENVTPAGLGPWSKVGIIDPSHFDGESAYAAVDRHRVDDSRPYVYRTHDGGRTWTLAATGIPAGSFVNALREDPVRRGLLYAGTEKGVYVSFDDGDHWQPLQLNLPVTSVRDIDVHGDDLVIATHGRAFWVLDDVTAAPGRARRRVRPRVALRSRDRDPAAPRRVHRHPAAQGRAHRRQPAAGLAEAEKLHVDLAAKGASDLDARAGPHGPRLRRGSGGGASGRSHQPARARQLPRQLRHRRGRRGRGAHPRCRGRHPQGRAGRAGDARRLGDSRAAAEPLGRVEASAP
jgi:photosystem II stability/assembly factor-like uncharacterized protein